MEVRHTCRQDTHVDRSIKVNLIVVVVHVVQTKTCITVLGKSTCTCVHIQTEAEAQLAATISLEFGLVAFLVGSQAG